MAKINNSCTYEEIIAVLEEVGLNPDNNDKVKKYSLGMKQRLGLAQSIMENPDILIWDEPTNGLDEAGVGFLQTKIADFKNMGKTILISSHDSEFLKEVCEKIFVLDNGRLINHYDIG